MVTIDSTLLDQLARLGADGDTIAIRKLNTHLREHWWQLLDSQFQMRYSMNDPKLPITPQIEQCLKEFEKSEFLQSYVFWCSKTRHRRVFVDWLVFVLEDAIHDELARRGASGDRAAIKTLIAWQYDGWLASIRRSWRLRDSAERDEDARDIALNLIGRVGKSDALKSYLAWREANPSKRFSDWMNIVIANTTRSHLKPNRGAVRNLSRMNVEMDGSSVHWQLVDEYCARQLKSVAVNLLSDDQLVALNFWLEGAAFAEIAKSTSFSETQAQHLVRAAIARLRRRFVSEDNA